MKSTRLLAVIILSLSFASLPLMAQQAGANAQAQPAASGSAADYAHMRPVSGELLKNLDSKSARVGEPVVLKTTEKTTIGNIELPKGSQLLGHVTEVQAHTKDHEGARIGIEFDQAAPKGGQSFAIHSMIESASLPASVLGEERTRGWGLAGPGPSGPAYAGRPVRGTATATSDLAGSGEVGNAVLTADANGGQIHSSVDESATGIPDVMLTANDAGPVSGVLSAAKKNFRLDSGTQMVVGVVATGK